MSKLLLINTYSSKPRQLFFRIDHDYGPKSCDKSNKALPLSQNQNNSN